MKSGLNFQTQLPLRGCGYETKQHIRDLKHAAGVQMISLCTESDTLLIPPLIFTDGVKMNVIWLAFINRVHCV